MFTQAMPALVDALRGVLPPEAIGPLTQALGNCAQPLTHRAGINLVAPAKQNQNGTYGGGPFNSAWNPASYQNLFPGGGVHNSANYHTAVDVGDMSVTWQAGNRYDSQFYFPTNQVFTQNQFFGGPTLNVSGGGNIDYITNQYFQGDTVEAERVNTDELNGDPVAGPPGPPGAPGRDGQRGAPGAPGGFFGALPPGFFGPIRYLSGRPRIAPDPRAVARPHRYIKDAWVRKAISVGVPTNAIKEVTVDVSPAATDISVPSDAISGGTVALDPTPVEVTVPLTFSFDPDTCSVVIDSTTTVYAFPSAPVAMTINGTSATAATVTVASTATVGAAVSTTPADTATVIAATTAASTNASVVAAGGFVIKGADADFWERQPGSVLVAGHPPRIVGVIPANARVYQQ
jgi:hypothetical protein